MKKEEVEKLFKDYTEDLERLRELKGKEYKFKKAVLEEFFSNPGYKKFILDKDTTNLYDDIEEIGSVDYPEESDNIKMSLDTCGMVYIDYDSPYEFGWGFSCRVEDLIEFLSFPETYNAWVEEEIIREERTQEQEIEERERAEYLRLKEKYEKRVDY